MGAKIRVGVIFGGKSAEHEVSLQSAYNIVDNIDTEKFDIVLIGIDKKGGWCLGRNAKLLLDQDYEKLRALGFQEGKTAIVPFNHSGHLADAEDNRNLEKLDVIFPVLHGPYGEDGTIQGMLKLANIPFVSADVLASAVSMDKDVMKRLLKEAGIPIARYIIFDRSSSPNIRYEKIKRELGMPVFIKPANLGSSVGIVKSEKESDFKIGVEQAFQYDNKIIIEEYIQGREIECSVLGNENPIASLPGEVKLNAEFYSYEAKYLDENGAVLDIPARLSPELVKEVQMYAIKVFKTLCCEGMARVDFFLSDSGKIVVNELNTIPGFTKISMYPKLWEASGISYTELIGRLITLAIERFKRDGKLKVTY